MSCYFYGIYFFFSNQGENERFYQGFGQFQVVKIKGSSNINMWGKKFYIMVGLRVKEEYLVVEGMLKLLVVYFLNKRKIWMNFKFKQQYFISCDFIYQSNVFFFFFKVTIFILENK